MSESASPILDVYAAQYPYSPDAPTLVSVTANLLDSSITIAWTAPNNGGLPILGYYLQRNSGYGSSLSPVLIPVDASTSTYTFNNLIAGAVYQFRVTAYNLLEAENKQFDDHLNFSPVATFIAANVPSKITTLAQNTQGYQAGTVWLLWQKPEENGSKILLYSVSRDVGSGVFFEVYRGLNPSFTDSALRVGQSYNYKVKAFNAKGFGPDSE
jgi:hypothetical protein